MSNRMNIHYKLVIDPEDAPGAEGNGVVFIDHEQVGRFAAGTDEDKLPKTAADAIDLCVEYCRTMQLGILCGIIPAEQTERYRVKGDEYAEMARKIRAGEVRTTYALSVERYLIREFNADLEDFDESTVEDGPDAPCTCHPSDNPPVPCAKKYALSECVRASVEAECKVPPPGWRCTRKPGHDGPCAAIPTEG